MNLDAVPRLLPSKVHPRCCPSDFTERALGHLRSLLPRRVWDEALASAPLISTRADNRDLARPATPPAANDPR